MRRRVWVLVKMQNERHPTWANYTVHSKKSWQKQAARQKEYTCGIRYTWVAESEDKAVLEGMMNLTKED